MEKAQILKAIGAIGKASTALTKHVQTCAVECTMFAIEHGNVTLADQLVDALGKGMRKASLRAWFERNTPMFIGKGKTTFGLDTLRLEAFKALDVAELKEKLMATPWEDAKPEEKIESVIDVAEAFDKFMKRLDGLTKDAGITVKHRELLALLKDTSAKFHSEEVVKARTETTDAE